MGACSQGGCGSGCGSGGFFEAPIAESGKVIWSSADAAPATPFELNERVSQSVPSQPLRVTSAEAREHLYRILGKVEQHRIPFWTHLDLTYKCNTDCIHCYCQHLDPAFGGKYDRKDLTTAELIALLDQLADYGALNLTLSGGELFVRKDFFDIAFYASREKHFALSLYSNGTLINERIAERIAQLAPVVVEISLQGATAEVHDAIVQRPGSFGRVVVAVKSLRSRGVNVVLKTTLMQQNIHQADDIVRLSSKLGATSYRNSFEVTPKNDGDTGVMQHQLSDAQLASYLSHDFPFPWQYEKPVPVEQARQRVTCGTGVVACYISPYGDVYPCIQLLIPMGNIRERSFKDIWEEKSELRRKLDSIQMYGDLPDCKECEYVQLCQRCHGLAYLETGDLTKCYKMALRVAKVKTAVNAKSQQKQPIAIQLEGEPILINSRMRGMADFGQ